MLLALAAYLAYGIATGRFRERLLPIRMSEFVRTVRDTLHFHVAHEDLTVYNAVQKMLYIAVILAGIAQVVTGRRSQLAGVRRTQTMVAFEVYSRHDLEALFSVGQ